MEPPESIRNPQELDRTVDKFTEACNFVSRRQGNQEGAKTPLVDPTTINPQNQLQMPV